MYISGSSTFSAALVRASRLNCWKTNPIFLFRISASWSLLERADADAVQRVAPGRRRVEAPEDVHQRGFAGSGRPHDRDELPALDLERDALQDVHRHFSQLVVLDQILDFDDGCHVLT